MRLRRVSVNMSTCACGKAVSSWPILAYAKLLDNGFGLIGLIMAISRYLNAYRQIGVRLVDDPRANAVRNIVWILMINEFIRTLDLGWSKRRSCKR